MRVTIALAALLASSVAAEAQQSRKQKLLPGQGIEWLGNWEEAVKEATARNVPIMFTLHKDN